MRKLISNFRGALKYAWNGLKYTWPTQWAFRLEFIVLLIAVPLAFYIGKSLAEVALLISSVSTLLVLELLNTAIETTVNRISFEHHELSGLAKDLGSSAVIVATVNTLVTWGIIAIPHVISYFN